MMSTLAQIEFSMEKKLFIHNMNEKEMKNYEVIYEKIGNLCFMVLQLDTFHLNSVVFFHQNQNSIF